MLALRQKLILARSLDAVFTDELQQRSKIRQDRAWSVSIDRFPKQQLLRFVRNEAFHPIRLSFELSSLLNQLDPFTHTRITVSIDAAKVLVNPGGI